MAVTWRIGNDLLRIQSDKDATFEEWRGALDEALAHRDYRHGTPVLHDLSRIKREPSAAETKERVEVMMSRAKVYGFKRWASVVTGPATFGMTRMAQAFASGGPIEFRGFKTLADAEAWVRSEP